MNQLNSMLWTETSKNTYERYLDAAELFYTTMAKAWEGTGHTYFAITASIGVTVPLRGKASLEESECKFLDALRYAWKRVRIEHPSLAARVQFDPLTKKCKKVYKVLENEDELNEWVAQTFKIVKGIVTGMDFANTDPDFGNHAFLWITNPSSAEDSRRQGFLARDLVFRCGHDIVDGIGTLKLFDIMLSYATEFYSSSQPLDVSKTFIFGNEYKKLSAPLHIAAKMPQTPTTEQISKLKALQAANTKARKEAQVFGVPISLKTNMPLKSQRSALPFSISETAEMISKCKTFGVTATHLFHAAIALAVRDLQAPSEKEGKGRYMSYALINLRGVCEGSNEKVDLHPASVRQTVSVKHLVVDLQIPRTSTSISPAERKKELLKALDQVREFYREVTVLDRDFLDTVPALYEAVTPGYPESTPEVPKPNPNPAVSLSSFGVVDKLIERGYGDIKAQDPWVIGAEYSSGLGCFLGTWNGRMELSVGWNEAFYEVGEAMGFLKKVKRAAEEILDVIV